MRLDWRSNAGVVTFTPHFRHNHSSKEQSLVVWPCSATCTRTRMCLSLGADLGAGIYICSSGRDQQKRTYAARGSPTPPIVLSSFLHLCRRRSFLLFIALAPCSRLRQRCSRCAHEKPVLCVQPGYSDGSHETASLHRIAARDRKFYETENRRGTRANYSRISVRRALILSRFFSNRPW